MAKPFKLYAKKELPSRRAEIGTIEQIVDMLKVYDPKVTVSAYQKWEQGINPIDVRLAMFISDMLGISPSKLFKTNNKDVKFVDQLVDQN